ncbi:MAG: ATP-binding protein, partial [Bacteroidales bacterium]|nr:ATP-binding protein [Bacteroidales bacterium]
FADLRSVNAVVRNLITNAIKFSYPGSTINISVDEFSDDNNFAIISVADNGVGMTEEQKQHLFDNNSPSTTAGTQNEKGTGLGLLLCRDLVEKNGGKIWAKDNKPQGTVFCFTLSFA